MHIDRHSNHLVKPWCYRSGICLYLFILFMIMFSFYLNRSTSSSRNKGAVASFSIVNYTHTRARVYCECNAIVGSILCNYAFGCRLTYISVTLTNMMCYIAYHIACYCAHCNTPHNQAAKTIPVARSHNTWCAHAHATAKRAKAPCNSKQMCAR